VITQLLTPFGTPFDLSVLVGALLTIAAVVLASRHRDDNRKHRDGSEPRSARTPTGTGGGRS
jgi:hypothetical protein